MTKRIKIFCLIIVLCLVKISSSEFISSIIGSSISIGTSVATAYTTNSDYRIRVIIELENWSIWVLNSPVVHINGGVLCTPPSNILPIKKEALSARKTAHTASGSYGTASWLVGNFNKRIVLMWSAPFNFDFYSNWMGLGITTEDVHDKSLFENMYYKKMIPELKTYKIEEYYYRSKEIMVQDEDFEFKGTMGTSHHPTIKLYLKPKNRSNIHEKIRDHFK